MELLKCMEVDKVFGKGDNQVTALHNINLSINQGEFVTIVGASGSGKSTLLHILGSVDKPTGNLDRKNSMEIIDLLKLFHRNFNQTILLITHDETIALEAERIITIADGTICSDQKRR